jgi:hypothetical protein
LSQKQSDTATRIFSGFTRDRAKPRDKKYAHIIFRAQKIQGMKSVEVKFPISPPRSVGPQDTTEKKMHKLRRAGSVCEDDRNGRLTNLAFDLKFCSQNSREPENRTLASFIQSKAYSVEAF